MGILDNLESAWDEEFKFESSGKKIFSENCCNGCGCTTEQDHKKDASQ